MKQNGFIKNSGWTTKGNTWVQGRSEGAGLRKAKSWAAQGVVILMLKLPPPSAAATGILPQLGCWNHLGGHRASHCLGRAFCTALQGSQGQQAGAEVQGPIGSGLCVALPVGGEGQEHGHTGRLSYKNSHQHQPLGWCNAALAKCRICTGGGTKAALAK